nr:hypothetical protein [Armatimonas sp.]
MKVADEPDYFEAQYTTRFGNRIEVSAYRGGDQVLIAGSILTPRQARQLAHNLLKASKLAKQGGKGSP